MNFLDRPHARQWYIGFRQLLYSQCMYRMDLVQIRFVQEHLKGVARKVIRISNPYKALRSLT